MEISNETNENNTGKKTVGQAEKGTAGNRGDFIQQAYSFASDVKLKECKYCCVMIPKKAKICPNCKMSLRSHWFLKSAAAVLAVVVIALGSYCLSAYWGLHDGSAIPGWVARNTVLAPAMSALDASGAGTDMVLVEEGKIAGSTVAAGVQVSGNDSDAKATAKSEESKQEASSISQAADEKKQETSAAGQTTDEKKQETSKPSGVSDERGVTAGEKQEGLGESETADKKKQEASGENGAADDDVVKDMVAKADSGEAEEDAGKTAENGGETDAKEASFREKCVSVDYKALLREQDVYMDAPVIVEAQVIRQMGGGLFDDHVYYLCRAEEKDGFERYYIIRDDREADGTLILEGDMITVYGSLFGECRIPATLLETQPVVPAVSMLYCDLA